MIEIGCLACSKIIKMPQYIDTEKYDGQVVCEECNSLLYIKLVKGKVEKYKLLENKRKPDIKIAYVPANYKAAEGREYNF